VRWDQFDVTREIVEKTGRDREAQTNKPKHSYAPAATKSDIASTQSRTDVCNYSILQGQACRLCGMLLPN
jgi:hypothetical protein